MVTIFSLAGYYGGGFKTLIGILNVQLIKPKPGKTKKVKGHKFLRGEVHLPVNCSQNMEEVMVIQVEGGVQFKHQLAASER